LFFSLFLLLLPLLLLFVLMLLFLLLLYTLSLFLLLHSGLQHVHAACSALRV
jgi:hypothetical protein